MAVHLRVHPLENFVAPIPGRNVVGDVCRISPYAADQRRVQRASGTSWFVSRVPPRQPGLVAVGKFKSDFRPRVRGAHHQDTTLSQL